MPNEEALGVEPVDMKGHLFDNFVLTELHGGGLHAIFLFVFYLLLEYVYPYNTYNTTGTNRGDHQGKSIFSFSKRIMVDLH
jgi:hypothetical protein